jgi:hypothetical protein
MYTPIPLPRLPLSITAAAEPREAAVGFVTKLDHTARTHQDGLKDPIVHSPNALKADRVHEPSDLGHRDREIGRL